MVSAVLLLRAEHPWLCLEKMYHAVPGSLSPGSQPRASPVGKKGAGNY